MRRTTHLLSGVAVGAVASSLIGRESFDLYVIGAAFALFPDADLLFARLSRRIHRSPASHGLLASLMAGVTWGILLSFSGRVSFLEFLAVWSASAGLKTGVLERGEGSAGLTRNPTKWTRARWQDEPWPPILRMVRTLARRCRERFPDQLEHMELIIDSSSA